MIGMKEREQIPLPQRRPDLHGPPHDRSRDLQGRCDLAHRASRFVEPPRPLELFLGHPGGPSPLAALRLDPEAGGGDPLVDREPLHLRRPAHDGEDDLGGRAVEYEAVGDRDDLDTRGAQLLDQLEGVADAGAREPVEPVDIEPADLA